MPAQHQDLFVHALTGWPSPPWPDRTASYTDDGHLHHCRSRPSRTPQRAEGIASQLAHRGLWGSLAQQPATHTTHGAQTHKQFQRQEKRSQNVLASLPGQAPPTTAGTTVGRCQSHWTFLEKRGSVGSPSTFRKKDGKAKLTMLPKIPEGVKVSGPCG